MHINCRKKLILSLTLLYVHYIHYSNVIERCCRMEASGVHRQEALTKQAVCHASPLAYIVGPHGFLKEASTCRIEAGFNVPFQYPRCAVLAVKCLVALAYSVRTAPFFPEPI
jgi:hypothetical protein